MSFGILLHQSILEVRGLEPSRGRLLQVRRLQKRISTRNKSRTFNHGIHMMVSLVICLIPLCCIMHLSDHSCELECRSKDVQRVQKSYELPRKSLLDTLRAISARLANCLGIRINSSNDQSSASVKAETLQGSVAYLICPSNTTSSSTSSI